MNKNNFYEIYSGSYKMGVSDKEEKEPQCICSSLPQAKHMILFWGKFGYYKKIKREKLCNK